MSKTNVIFDVIAKLGVVPVIACESAESALPLADALIEGGLPVAEITFRTPAAAEVIRIIASKRPEMIVGAGTVLSPETAKIAIDCGAKFAVAPGMNLHVMEAAAAVGLPFVPGVCSPSDVERGLEFGCKLLKFFPAEAVGGVKLLSAIYAPYKHTGVRFMPTGGVTPDNLDTYLKLAAVAACGGTWIAKTSDINDGKWAEISARCKAAVEKVRSLRN